MGDLDLNIENIYYGLTYINNSKEKLSELSSVVNDINLSGVELSTAGLLNDVKSTINGILNGTLSNISDRLENTKKIIVDNDVEALLLFAYLDGEFNDEFGKFSEEKVNEYIEKKNQELYEEAVKKAEEEHNNKFNNDPSYRYDVILANLLSQNGYESLQQIDDKKEEFMTKIKNLQKRKNEILYSDAQMTLKFLYIIDGTNNYTVTNFNSLSKREILAYRYIDENGLEIYCDSQLAIPNQYIGKAEALTYSDMCGETELYNKVKSGFEDNLFYARSLPSYLTGNSYIMSGVGTTGSYSKTKDYEDFYNEVTNITINEQSKLEEINTMLSSAKGELSNLESVKQGILDYAHYYTYDEYGYILRDDFEENCKNISEDEIDAAINNIKNKPSFSSTNIDNIPGAMSFSYTSSSITLATREEEMQVIYSLISGSDKFYFGQGSVSYIDENGKKVYLKSNDDLFSNYSMWASEMSEKQKQIFYYNWNTGGYEAAYEYLDSISDVLDSTYIVNQTKRDQEFASAHPGTASALSVLMGPIEGLDAIRYSMQQKFNDDKMYRSQLYAAGDTMRNQVSEDIGKSGKFGAKANAFMYNVSMSVADNLFSMVLTGGNPVASGIILGAGGYDNSINDALNRGLTDDEARLYATSMAVVEAATESWSLDKLVNIKWLNNLDGQKALSQILGKTFDQAKSEGLEELTSSIVGEWVDQLIAGENSAFNLSVQDYIAQGYSEEQALALAQKDQLLNFGESFLSGFVSGGMTGGGKITGSYISNVHQNHKNKNMFIDSLGSVVSENIKSKNFAGAIDVIMNQEGKTNAEKVLYANTVIAALESFQVIDADMKQKLSDSVKSFVESHTEVKIDEVKVDIKNTETKDSSVSDENVNNVVVEDSVSEFVSDGQYSSDSIDDNVEKLEDASLLEDVWWENWGESDDIQEEWNIEYFLEDNSIDLDNVEPSKLLSDIKWLTIEQKEIILADNRVKECIKKYILEGEQSLEFFDGIFQNVDFIQLKDVFDADFIEKYFTNSDNNNKHLFFSSAFNKTENPDKLIDVIMDNTILFEIFNQNFDGFISNIETFNDLLEKMLYDFRYGNVDLKTKILLLSDNVPLNISLYESLTTCLRRDYRTNLSRSIFQFLIKNDITLSGFLNLLDTKVNGDIKQDDIHPDNFLIKRNHVYRYSEEKMIHIKDIIGSSLFDNTTTLIDFLSVLYNEHNEGYGTRSIKHLDDNLLDDVEKIKKEALMWPIDLQEYNGKYYVSSDGNHRSFYLLSTYLILKDKYKDNLAELEKLDEIFQVNAVVHKKSNYDIINKLSYSLSMADIYDVHLDFDVSGNILGIMQVGDKKYEITSETQFINYFNNYLLSLDRSSDKFKKLIFSLFENGYDIKGAINMSNLSNSVKMEILNYCEIFDYSLSGYYESINRLKELKQEYSEVRKRIDDGTATEIDKINVEKLFSDIWLVESVKDCIKSYIIKNDLFVPIDFEFSKEYSKFNLNIDCSLNADNKLSLNYLLGVFFNDFEFWKLMSAIEYNELYDSNYTNKEILYGIVRILQELNSNGYHLDISKSNIGKGTFYNLFNSLNLNNTEEAAVEFVETYMLKKSDLSINSKYQFYNHSDGRVGSDQHAIANAFSVEKLSTENGKKFANDLIEQVKNKFPGISSQMSMDFLKRIDSTVMSDGTKGTGGICNYADVANAIFEYFHSLANPYEEFERVFGFPMYRDGHLNDTQLLLDMFINISGNELISKGFFGKYKLNINNRRYLNLATNYLYDHLYRADYIGKYLRDKGIFDSNDIIIQKQLFNSKHIEYSSNNYISDSTLSYDKKYVFNYLMKNIHNALKNGEHLSIASWEGLKMVRVDGQLTEIEHDEAHIMSIYGIDDDGNLLVDSWKDTWKIDLMQLLNDDVAFVIGSLSFGTTDNVSHNGKSNLRNVVGSSNMGVVLQYNDDSDLDYIDDSIFYDADDGVAELDVIPLSSSGMVEDINLDSDKGLIKFSKYFEDSIKQMAFYYGDACIVNGELDVEFGKEINKMFLEGKTTSEILIDLFGERRLAFENFLESIQGKFLSKLTSEQIKAFSIYSRGGAGIINESLRLEYGDLDKIYDIIEGEYAAELIELLDLAIEEYGGLDADTILHRAVTVESFFSHKNDLNKNDLYSLFKGLKKNNLQNDLVAVFAVLSSQIGKIDLMDYGFMSTSPGYSTSFASEDKYPIVLEIVAPKGTSGAYINQISSSYNKENEFLLSRGTKFLIDNVSLIEDVNGKHKILVRCTIKN